LGRWAALLLLACALLPFLPSRHWPMVHDDHDLRGPGSLVADPRADLALLLRADLFGSYERPWGVSGYWRPVTVVLARAEWWLTDGAPTAFAWVGHVMNLLLHALATWALARLLMAMAWPCAAAVGAAALFGAHPVHAEAVAWLSATGDTGAAAWGLLALERLTRGGARRDQLLAALLLLLGLGFKESAVLWLGLAFALGWLRGEGWRRALRVPVAAALLYVALRALAFHQGTDPSVVLTPQDAGTRWLTWLSVIPDVVRLSTWPGAPTPIHPVPAATSWAAPGVLAGLAVLALLIALSLAAARRRSAPALLALLALLGTVGLLAPVVRLPTGWPEMAAPLFERHLYVAAMAGPIALGLLAQRLAARYAAATLAAAALLALPLGLAARERATVWSSDEAFARAGLTVAPESDSLWNHLGYARLTALHEQQDPRAGEEALAAFDRALQLRPGQMLPELNRFLTLATLGRRDESEEAAVRLVDRWPSEPGVLDNVARWQLGEGRPAQAAALFERELATGRPLPGAQEGLAESRRRLEARAKASSGETREATKPGAEGGT
jgi:hypothetical protein